MPMIRVGVRASSGSKEIIDDAENVGAKPSANIFTLGTVNMKILNLTNQHQNRGMYFGAKVHLTRGLASAWLDWRV